MKVLLTGPIQIGKSTAIRKFLEDYTGSVGGFKTYKNGKNLMIAPYAGNDGEVCVVFEENGKRVMKEVFDGYGTQLVNNSPGDLLVFDELGRFELCSDSFTDAVLRKFDGDTPILGVIKPEHNMFLDAIRAKENLALIEVTIGNRDNLPALIKKYLNK